MERRKTHTSAAVKNRYNEKAYDRITIVVPKGQKDIIKQRAEELGDSINAFITKAIAKEMNGD